MAELEAILECTCGPNCDDSCLGYCGCESCAALDDSPPVAIETTPCPYCGDETRLKCREKGCGVVKTGKGKSKQVA